MATKARDKELKKMSNRATKNAGPAPQQAETPTQKLAYTYAEVAEILSCHYLTVFRMVKNGRLKSFRLNAHSFRVPKTEIDRLMSGGVV